MVLTDVAMYSCQGCELLSHAADFLQTLLLFFNNGQLGTGCYLEPHLRPDLGDLALIYSSRELEQSLRSDSELVPKRQGILKKTAFHDFGKLCEDTMTIQIFILLSLLLCRCFMRHLPLKGLDLFFVTFRKYVIFNLPEAFC